MSSNDKKSCLVATPTVTLHVLFPSTLSLGSLLEVRPKLGQECLIERFISSVMVINLNPIS